ncbi:MAG TPA: hypothetical protein VMB83_15495 [Roseiarcus sp.]|nr:hypothetical protein [Roseiarcus sp.]
MASLELHLERNGYVLRKTNADGTASELLLDHDDLLTLSHSAIEWSQLVLEAQPEGVNAIAATPVDNMGLNCDHHRAELHLELFRNGERFQVLAIPISTADRLAERLPSFLQEMEEYRNKLRKQ